MQLYWDSDSLVSEMPFSSEGLAEWQDYGPRGWCLYTCRALHWFTYLNGSIREVEVSYSAYSTRVYHSNPITVFASKRQCTETEMDT